MRADRFPFVIGAQRITETVQLGIAKLNVNADLRATYLTAIAKHQEDGNRADDLAGSLSAAGRALTAQLTMIIRAHTIEGYAPPASRFDQS